MFLLLCAGCDQVVDDECVLGEIENNVAQPAADSPRVLDPSDRVVSPEVRAYLESRQQQMEIIATTTTRRGQVYDWIDINSQVPGGQVASPPPLDPAPDRSSPGDTCGPLLARSELEEEPEALGPPGTVPVLRTDPDRIYAPGSVQDFLSKYGDASDIPSNIHEEDVPPPQVGPIFNHFYAKSHMKISNYGGEGYINLWEPFVLYKREQSTAQIAVTAGGSPTPLETVEAGWHVLGSRYGDFSTRFFVYFTTNGYTEQGPLKGGYNMVQSGWVQTSRTTPPGTILTPVSVLDGAQVEFYLRVQLHEGKWWVRYNDEFVGYYPASLFSENGLRTSADRIHFYGETNDDLAIEGMTPNDMGSGKFPIKGLELRTAAYMRFLQVQETPEGYDRSRYKEPFTFVSDPKCYDMLPKFDSTEPWQSHFYYGGDGQNKNCP
jgi:hypothetical protein